MGGVKISSIEIGFRIHKVVFLMDKISDKTLNDKIGVTLSQVYMMHVMKHRGLVSQRDIAKFWQMTDAAVSRQTEILLEKNLIKRRENIENRREYILSLTPNGQNYLQKAFKILDQTIGEIIADISENERKNFTQSLDKILQCVCQKQNNTV